MTSASGRVSVLFNYTISTISLREVTVVDKVLQRSDFVFIVVVVFLHSPIVGSSFGHVQNVWVVPNSAQILKKMGISVKEKSYSSLKIPIGED